MLSKIIRRSLLLLSYKILRMDPKRNKKRDLFEHWKTKNQQSLFYKSLKAYPKKKKAHRFLDNAIYYKNNKVSAYLKNLQKARS